MAVLSVLGEAVLSALSLSSGSITARNIAALTAAEAVLSALSLSLEALVRL